MGARSAGREHRGSLAHSIASWSTRHVRAWGHFAVARSHAGTGPRGTWRIWLRFNVTYWTGLLIWFALGGVVAYVTCSPHRAETVDQVRRLSESGRVELIDAVAVAAGISPEPLSADGPTLQLWPHRDDTDAMFMALMKRVS